MGTGRPRRSSELFDQIPPHNAEAELGVLGSVLVSDGGRLAEVAPILRPEDFYFEANGKLFSHFLAMQNGEKSPIDSTLLHARLAEHGDLEAVGGAEYLAKVLQSVPVASHAVHYAKIVHDHAVRRRIIAESLGLVKDAYSGQVSGAALAARGKGQFERVADGSAKATPKVAFSRLSSAELDAAEYSIEYLVDGTLVAGQPTIIAGGKKSLKTSLIVDLGISLSAAGSDTSPGAGSIGCGSARAARLAIRCCWPSTFARASLPIAFGRSTYSTPTKPGTRPSPESKTRKPSDNARPSTATRNESAARLPSFPTARPKENWVSTPGSPAAGSTRPSRRWSTMAT